ncbi:UNVERIFIED_CONTAM: hypothetical protein K2H54_063556 [Gekko kuhli]
MSIAVSNSKVLAPFADSKTCAVGSGMKEERVFASRRIPNMQKSVFRRADKNDDGKLSFEEFKNCCADGILSSEELWELFSGIDRRHSE